MAIKVIQKENPEVIIYGEVPEWEMPEYIRDSIQQGKQKALIVLGHAESKAPGIKYLAHLRHQLINDVIGEGAYYSIGYQPIIGLKPHNRLACEGAKNSVDGSGVIIQAGKCILQNGDIITPVAYAQNPPSTYHSLILLPAY